MDSYSVSVEYEGRQYIVKYIGSEVWAVCDVLPNGRLCDLWASRWGNGRKGYGNLRAGAPKNSLETVRAVYRLSQEQRRVIRPNGNQPA
jgi:hypothetical protein